MHQADNRTISTGSLKLDLTLQAGGLPRGEVILVRGPADSGKTAFCTGIAASVSKTGNVAAFLDADLALEPRFALSQGADPDRFIFGQPGNQVECLAMAEELLHSGALSLLVIDSINSLTDEENEATNEQQLATRLPTLENSARMSGAVIVITERIMDRPPVVYHGLRSHLARFALPLRAKIHFEMELRPGNPPVSDQVNPTSAKIRLGVHINKGKRESASSPVEVILYYNEINTNYGDIIDLGIHFRVIKNINAFYVYQGQQLGKHRSAMEEYLRQDPELAWQIEQDIRRSGMNS